MNTYLRQDKISTHCMIPSNTFMNPAGPEQLGASKSGRLSMYLKDSKGILHQMLLKMQKKMLQWFKGCLKT